MSVFDKQEPRYRLVVIRYGDDLRAIAQREMGDAQLWPDIVWLNNLSPPYITADPAQASASVLLVGSKIKVPAVSGLSSEEADADRLYARDVRLTRRQLQATQSGDLSIVAGLDNLRQQLGNRLATPPGQLQAHPDYGCLVWRLLGTVNGPVAGLLGADYVRAALRADYRVREARNVTAAVSGDTVSITGTAIAIDGSELSIAI